MGTCCSTHRETYEAKIIQAVFGVVKVDVMNKPSAKAQKTLNKLNKTKPAATTTSTGEE